MRLYFKNAQQKQSFVESLGKANGNRTVGVLSLEFIEQEFALWCKETKCTVKQLDMYALHIGAILPKVANAYKWSRVRTGVTLTFKNGKVVSWTFTKQNIGTAGVRTSVSSYITPRLNVVRITSEVANG